MKLFMEAFKKSLPVLCGYAFLGLVYGILMSQIGLQPWHCFLFSALVCGGSIQYALIPLIVARTSVFSAFILSLSVNARHIFYGLSSIKRYENAKGLKPFLIFTLTDETFGVVSDIKENNPKLYFYVHLLNYSYWIIFSTLGGVLGSFTTITIKGLDFSLTALFLVMFLNQLMSKEYRNYAIWGLVISFICLLIFKNDFIIYAMVIMVVVLMILKKKGAIKHE